MTTEANTQASDIFDMSDDELLNMSSAEGTQNNPAEDKEPVNNTEVLSTENTDNEVTPTTDNTVVEDNTDVNTLSTDTVNDKVNTNNVDSNGQQITSDAPSTQPSGLTVDGKDKQDNTVPESDGLPTDFNYKANYEKVMAPFKANGKMITPRSPEEVISLMQMGANYTRKLQELQPYRKVMLMLENNGLMDEGKLSYLIDLDKKDPEAIKKLLVDSEIDPLDIDTNEPVKYQEGNHRVSDDEAAFVTELDDIKSTPEGQATLGIISQTWDDTSKQALLENRGWLRTIHEQRENGMYDRIVQEIDHQRTLGHVPVGISFIESYKIIGDYLAKQNAFAHQQNQAPSAVATRVATPKSGVTNSQQASAASPSRNAPRKAEAFVNPLTMSDEDFMKLPRPQSR